MDTKRFNEVLKEKLTEADEVLGSKAAEYATDDDRLHNFKVAAQLQGNTPAEALAGMMAKHTVSVYDLIRDQVEITDIPLAMWDEKITDHINYLLLLNAIVREAYDEQEAKVPKNRDLNPEERFDLGGGLQALLRDNTKYGRLTHVSNPDLGLIRRMRNRENFILWSESKKLYVEATPGGLFIQEIDPPA